MILQSKTDAGPLLRAHSGQMASGVATGGTRNTEIHINIGDMIKTVNFNGGVQENIKEVERMFAETLSRVLGMAELSV